MSGEEPTDDNDGSVFFSLKKQRQNFARVCIILVIVVIYLLTEKKYMFKGDDENVDFPTQFFFGRISENVTVF